MSLYHEHARDLLKMPPEWKMYRFEVMDHDNPIRDARTICISGAVAPLITRGDHKGQPNWRKLDRSTDRKAYFTVAEHRTWVQTWEQNTGKCSQCEGSGSERLPTGRQGVVIQTCGRCRGSGKPENVC